MVNAFLVWNEHKKASRYYISLNYAKAASAKKLTKDSVWIKWTEHRLVCCQQNTHPDKKEKKSFKLTRPAEVSDYVLPLVDEWSADSFKIYKSTFFTQSVENEKGISFSNHLRLRYSTMQNPSLTSDIMKNIYHISFIQTFVPRVTVLFRREFNTATLFQCLTSLPHRMPQVSTERLVLASASLRKLWHSSAGTANCRRASTIVSVKTM